MGTVIQGSFGQSPPNPHASGSPDVVSLKNQVEKALQLLHERMDVAMAHVRGSKELASEVKDSLRKHYDGLANTYAELKRRMSEVGDPTLILTYDRDLRSLDSNTTNFEQGVAQVVKDFKVSLAVEEKKLGLGVVSTQPTNWLLIGGITAGVVTLAAIIWIALRKPSGLPAGSFGKLPRYKKNK